VTQLDISGLGTDDGELVVVEVQGQGLDEVSGIDARALKRFLEEHLPCS
jgi:hypothetical protein